MSDGSLLTEMCRFQEAVRVRRNNQSSQVLVFIFEQFNTTMHTELMLKRRIYVSIYDSISQCTCLILSNREQY